LSFTDEEFQMVYKVVGDFLNAEYTFPNGEKKNGIKIIKDEIQYILDHGVSDVVEIYELDIPFELPMFEGMMQQGVQETKEVIDEIYEKVVQELLVYIAEQGLEKGKEIVGRGKIVIGEGVEKGREVIGEGVEKGKEIVGKGKVVIEHVGEGVEKGKEVIENVGKHTEKVIEDVGRKMTKKTEKVISKVTEDVAKHTEQAVGNFYSNHKTLSIVLVSILVLIFAFYYII